MTNKDEASPRQRQIMEQRWAKAKVDCPAGTCLPASRFHIAGCERRQQKIKVTNLSTGQISEATIVHSDVRAVKEVLSGHKNQAVKLTPLHEEVTFPGDEYWDAFERGEPQTRSNRGYGSPDVSISFADSRRVEESPTRPWWKFWGRRG